MYLSYNYLFCLKMNLIFSNLCLIYPDIIIIVLHKQTRRLFVGYPIVFGILLVAAGGSCIACGLYAIQNDIKTPINRAFLALSCAVLLWCLGLAITAVAENEAICSLGRRSLLPWAGAQYSAFCCTSFLLLTQKNRLLKKWWIYPLLYLPAIVTVFRIHLSSAHQFRTRTGWFGQNWAG